jgi:hypothetical protein
VKPRFRLLAFDETISVGYPSATTWECVVAVQPGVNRFDVTDGTDTITVDVVTGAGVAAGHADVSGQMRVGVPLTGRADGHGGATSQRPGIPAAFQGGADGHGGASGTLRRDSALSGRADGHGGAGAGIQGGASPSKVTPGRMLHAEAADGTVISFGIPILRARAADESSITVHVFPFTYSGDVALAGRASGAAGATAIGSQQAAKDIIGRAEGKAGAHATLSGGLAPAFGSRFHIWNGSAWV